MTTRCIMYTLNHVISMQPFLGPNCRYLSLRMSIPWGVRRDSCTHRQQLIETTFFEAAAAVGLLSNVLTTNSLQIPWVLGSSVARVCDQRREGHRFNSGWRFRFFSLSRGCDMLVTSFLNSLMLLQKLFKLWVVSWSLRENLLEE